MLGVNTISQYGAVSSETAQQMAFGALKNSHADLSVAVTGIAGPGGGSQDKPVGTVYIASSATNEETIVEKHLFKGNRDEIRSAATDAALELCIKMISKMSDRTT